MRSRFTAAVLMSVTLAALQNRADDVTAGAGTTGGSVQWLTSAQMQADFDLMRHALEEAHPGLYRLAQVVSQVLAQVVSQVLAQVVGPVNSLPPIDELASIAKAKNLAF